LDVFRYLKRKALEQFEKAEKERNEDRMERLYPVIRSINVDLIDLQNQSDLIKAEVLLRKKEKAESSKEDLDKVIESDKTVL
jgi:L-lysine 2,3-aminomutase